MKDLLLKLTINRYIKKLNRKMLTNTYIDLSKKNPKTHIDNVYLGCIVKEFKRRGYVI